MQINKQIKIKSKHTHTYTHTHTQMIELINLINTGTD